MNQILSANLIGISSIILLQKVFHIVPISQLLGFQMFKGLFEVR